MMMMSNDGNDHVKITMMTMTMMTITMMLMMMMIEVMMITMMTITMIMMMMVPVNPGKHLHSPDSLSQVPLLEHSASL